MRVFSSQLQFTCQLAALAAGAAIADTGSKVAEIDLILPAPNTTYQAGEMDRFPMVWAVRNPNQWQSGNADLIYSVYPSSKGSLESYGSVPLNKLNSSDPQVFYATANIIAGSGQDFNVSWYVSGSKCDGTKGFNDKDAASFLKFSTKPDGQKADFAAAAKSNCKSRPALAYDFSISTNDDESCRTFDEEDPFPETDPCGLKIADSAAATVQKSLDDQLKQYCDNRPNGHICPLPKTESTNNTSTDKKNAAASLKMDAGTLILGLGLSMVAFVPLFLS